MKYLLLIPGLVIGIAATAFADNGRQPAGLDRESLFRILAGEFAVYRQQYDTAQQYYQAQSATTDDAWLAERATRLSMYSRRYADMLQAARKWRANAPADDNITATFFLSLAYAFNNQPNVALEHMRHVLNKGGETDFTRLVNLLPADHDSEMFYLNELQQASLQHKNHYDLALARAILHNRLGNPAETQNAIEQAVELAPGNPAVVEYAVRLYLKQQRPQQAMAIYHKAIEHNPTDMELRLALARLAMRHDLEEAQKQLQYLLGHSPDDDYIILNLGLAHLRSGQLDKAEEMFQLLLRNRQQVSSANYYLGLVYRQKGDFENAMASFLAVNDPEQRKLAKEQLISLYIDKELYAEAATRIDKSLDTDDRQHREALLQLKARIHEEKGEITQAYSILSSLLDNNPDSIELRYSRAMLAETENRIQQAEQDLRHIINLKPDNALALNALGYTLANKTDRYREAYELIKQAHALLPDDPAILDSLGWVLFRMGETQKALGYLQQAMDAYPDAEIAAHLGEVLWTLGRKDEARDVLRKALDENPSHHLLNQTVKRLNVSL